MKTLSCMAAAVVSALSGWAMPQDTAGGGGRFVAVEVIVGKESRASHKFQVPVAGPGGRKNLSGDQLAGGEYGWTSSCPRDTGCSYSIFVSADHVSEDSSRVTVDLKYADLKKCNQSKEFVVRRGRPAEVGMRCGAKVKVGSGRQAKAAS